MKNLGAVALLLAFATSPGFAAGRISGNVLRAVDHSPIPNGTVEIFDAEGRQRDSAQVVDGGYSSGFLAAGSYFARVQNTRDEVGQLFGGGPFCFNGHTQDFCDPTSGTPIAVRDRGEARADFSLITGAFIEGTVLDPHGQPLLEYFSITVYTSDNRPIWADPHLADSYRAGPFPPGLYAVAASSPSHPAQLYPDEICISPCAFDAGGDAIALQTGLVRNHVDFHLHDFGALSGRVQDRATGAAIDHADVRLYDAASRREVRSVRTGADGNFRWLQLPPGDYLAVASSEYHEWRTAGDFGFLEPDLDAALAAATPFTVPENGQLELPPFRLRPLGKIRGRLVDEATGSPLPYGNAAALVGDRQPAAAVAASDAEGYFEIAGLAPGIYYLLVDGPGARDLLAGFDGACPASQFSGFYAVCDPTEGTPFQVNIGQVADAGEIRVPEEGHIRGTLRLAEGRIGRPVLLLDIAGPREIAQFHPNVQVSEYEFDLAVPGGGTYYLGGWSQEHLLQVYQGLDCKDNVLQPYCLNFGLATPIHVAPGEIRSGIDFDLTLDRRPCFPGPKNLCLGNGRFTLSAVYDDPHGALDAAAFRITDEAGYFTFFDPGNVEVVAKMLDACDEFGSFWLFATGLTDVGNSLVVRDNWAAIRWVYTQYGPYRPFVDTVSFQTCDVPPPAALENLEPTAAQPPAPTPQPIVPTGCDNDPAVSLCLGDRFEVEAEWTTAGGQSGHGVPQPLTGETGFFYFFSPGNIEVVVKVLDACRADLNQRYWVFAAGLTDVAVTLKVTDTTTRDEKIYLSPLGRLFQPVLDLEGFATCP